MRSAKSALLSVAWLRLGHVEPISSHENSVSVFIVFCLHHGRAELKIFYLVRIALYKNYLYEHALYIELWIANDNRK